MGSAETTTATVLAFRELPRDDDKDLDDATINKGLSFAAPGSNCLMNWEIESAQGKAMG